MVFPLDRRRLNVICLLFTFASIAAAALSPTQANSLLGLHGDSDQAAPLHVSEAVFVHPFEPVPFGAQRHPVRNARLQRRTLKEDRNKDDAEEDETRE